MADLASAEKMITLWTDNGGILGLIILALFCTIWALVWKFVTWIMTNSQAELALLLNQHAEERKDWRRDFDRISLEYLQAFKENSAIQREIAVELAKLESRLRTRRSDD